MPDADRGRVWPRCLSAVLIASAAMIAGCGEDSPPAGARPPATLVRVGVLPVVNAAPLYLGLERGFFRKEGLNIRPQASAGGASIVAGVSSGFLQFGLANPVALVAAKARDASVQVVAAGGSGGSSARDAWASLLTLRSGPVERIDDLAGRRIAVNLRRDISELALRKTLEEEGVDPGDVEFVQVSLPQMNAALEAGRVDAIAAAEPFVTQAAPLGVRDLAPVYVRLAPDLPVALYFTSEQFALGNASVVARFTKALRRSFAYARASPEAVRRIVPTYTAISPEVAARIRLPVFDDRVDRPAVEEVARLSRRYGLIDERPDLTRLFPPQG